MLDFISKTLREYMSENGLEFTDFERAGLIYNSYLLPEEKHKRLEMLLAETGDEKLRAQLEKRLRSDMEDIKAFKNNTEGFVYVVNSYEYGIDPFACGYFARFEPAYELGKKQGCKFEIEKYRIVGYNGIEPLFSKGYLNPRLIGDTDENPVKENFEQTFHHHDGCFQYNKDGVMTSFYCADELKDDREVISMLYDLDRFENAFIFMPDPFEMGDIVKCLGSGEPGIVTFSHEHWENFLEDVRSGKQKNCDFFDASIVVDILNDDGTFSHDHINPAFLERYEPKEGDDEYNILNAGSELCKGNGSLEWFIMCYEEYKKRKINDDNS